MKPRNLTAIMNLPREKRYGVMAEGLALLAEHVGELRKDMEMLAASGRPRGAAVIDGLAREEAAKILILLDVARMGWENERTAAKQLRRFYDHLARGLYARLTQGRPADFGEVREYADDLRKGLYLDGPNSFDWIFRNSIEADREEALYVDYVTSEGVSSWTTPAGRAELGAPTPSLVIDIALALHRSGCTTEPGLNLIAQEWQDVDLDDTTHWVVVERINRRILQALHEDGLTTGDLTQRDVNLAISQWIFPLGSLDLTKITVSERELADLRQHEAEKLYAEYYGLPDEPLHEDGLN